MRFILVQCAFYAMETAFLLPVCISAHIPTSEKSFLKGKNLLPGVRMASNIYLWSNVRSLLLVEISLASYQTLVTKELGA